MNVKLASKDLTPGFSWHMNVPVKMVYLILEFGFPPRGDRLYSAVFH